MTQELQLDCLDQLAATPAILRGLICDLSVEDTEWKPAPDRFSVAEVLAHLSHSEGHCYRPRVDRFVSEELGAGRVPRSLRFKGNLGTDGTDPDFLTARIR